MYKISQQSVQLSDTSVNNANVKPQSRKVNRLNPLYLHVYTSTSSS